MRGNPVVRGMTDRVDRFNGAGHRHRGDRQRNQVPRDKNGDGPAGRRHGRDYACEPNTQPGRPPKNFGPDQRVRPEASKEGKETGLDAHRLVTTATKPLSCGKGQTRAEEQQGGWFGNRRFWLHVRVRRPIVDNEVREAAAGN